MKTWKGKIDCMVLEFRVNINIVKIISEPQTRDYPGYYEEEYNDSQFKEYEEKLKVILDADEAIQSYNPEFTWEYMDTNEYNRTAEHSIEATVNYYRDIIFKDELLPDDIKYHTEWDA